MVSRRRPQSRQLTQLQYWFAPRFTCSCWHPSVTVPGGVDLVDVVLVLAGVGGVGFAVVLLAGVGRIGVVVGGGAGGGRDEDEAGEPDTYVP